MPNHLTSSIRAAALLLALAACEREPTTTNGIVGVPPNVRTAPTTVTLGGKALTLETHLWRDFMPVAPPDGQPLIAVLRVRATGEGASVPANVQVDSAWVVLGEQAWASRPVQEQQRTATTPYLEVVSRNGPKWGPGVNVDVTVRLRDGAGNTALLRAAGRPIQRTD
jgi:hypothetical protein